MKKIFLILILIPLFSNISESQISVYPNLAFIDPVSRSGYIRVVNSADVAMEVDILSSFSYKNHDSVFVIRNITDSLMEAKHSMLKYLKVFPKRLVIQPKKDQMVRFLVMHPPGIADGTYTSTIKFISQPISKQVDTSDKKNVTMGVTLRTGIISMVIYQKGNLTTAIDLKNLYTSMDTSNLQLTFGIEKEGNSPYWGKAQISIFDTQGMAVDTVSEHFGIYTNTQKSFFISSKKTKFKPGTYTAEITVNTLRSDIPEEKTIKVAPLTRRFEFKLP
jgi:hypothetical protein